MNEIKSEIGECVLVLSRKRWGRYPIKGQLKSKSWWERRLESLVKDPTVITMTLDIEPTIDIPIPFEKEYPEAGEELRQIINGIHPRIKSVGFHVDKVRIYERQ